MSRTATVPLQVSWLCHAIAMPTAMPVPLVGRCCLAVHSSPHGGSQWHDPTVETVGSVHLCIETRVARHG